MRYWKACALSLTLIPTLAFAQTDKIDCKVFAAEQLKEIKQEYYGALTRDEAILARDVAERSCRALFDTVDEERATIQAYQPTRGEKTHWWEEEGKVKPNIKKAQKSGGK
jgi:hypothetical protein